MNTLAERLAWAREQKGLTQAALAKASRVSQSTIGNLESGIRSTARNIIEIAAALEVDPAWLANGDVGKAPVEPKGAKISKDAKSPPAPGFLDLKAETAAELRLLSIYRLANERERQAIDDVVDDMSALIERRATNKAKRAS